MCMFIKIFVCMFFFWCRIWYEVGIVVINVLLVVNVFCYFGCVRLKIKYFFIRNCILYIVLYIEDFSIF